MIPRSTRRRIAEAGDVEDALALVDKLELDGYHYLHSTRAELLRRLGRGDEAREAYDRALDLVHSEAERRFLERRLAEVGTDPFPRGRRAGAASELLDVGYSSVPRGRLRRRRGECRVGGFRVSGEAVACTTEQTLLGEGARWDARRDELLVVDILAGRVYRGRVADDGGLSLVRDYQVAGTVGAIVPIQGDEGWLLAAGRGFAHLSPDGSLRTLAEIAPAGRRMNDGACDPQGRVWAGTLAEDFRAGGGALYRLDETGRTELMLRDLTISNGLGWSPDGGTMYLADSGPRVIHAFSFDGERGTISDGSALVTIADEVGAPDGLTVDTDGDLWVAIYGGGRVHRYSPDGVLREALLVPALQTTSCAFAGPGLSRLYVTTATEGWSDEERRAEPAAGLVYRVDTDATGRPAEAFRPDPTWWAKVIS